MNWEQLKALLWLRWRLSLNQMKRGGRLNFFAGVVAVVGAYTLVLSATVGGFIAGWGALGGFTPSQLLLFWDICIGVFCLTLLVGLLHEIQRTEMIDLGKLLHLPIALPQLFSLNYASSLTKPSLLIIAPGLLSVSLGLAVSRGPAHLALVPLVLGFVFMITAWAYLIRGWLVSLMVNQRRKRSIVAALTVALVVLVQAPNLYFNLLRGNRPKGGRPPRAERVEHYANSTLTRQLHTALPPLWLAAGAHSVHAGRPAMSLLATLGCWTLGCIGLRLAFRSTMRFYQGVEGGRRPARTSDPHARQPTLTLPTPSRKRRMVEWNLPGVQSDVAGLAFASLRSMLRAPEIRLGMVGPFAMMAILGWLAWITPQNSMTDEAKAVTNCAFCCLVGFTLLQFLLNQFGFERNGFRSIVLLPTPRHSLLLGKNLSYAPFFLCPGVLGLVLIAVLDAGGLWIPLAGLLQLAGLFCILCVVGNVLSIAAPLRIGPGSLKPTKTPFKTILMMLGIHLLFPVFCVPVFLPVVADIFLHKILKTPPGLINLALSCIVAGGCMAAYGFSLDPLGRWFQQREKEMLATLTTEVE